MQLAFPHSPAWFGLLAVASLVGCGGYRPELPPTARVRGTVTLDGRPVANAHVQFIPNSTQGTEGAAAVAFTNAAGEYDLVTATVAGAIVGHHRISVEARAAPKNEMDTLPELLTPARYSDHHTSGLTAEVKAGEKNVIDLPLTIQPETR